MNKMRMPKMERQAALEHMLWRVRNFTDDYPIVENGPHRERRGTTRCKVCETGICDWAMLMHGEVQGSVNIDCRTPHCVDVFFLRNPPPEVKR